MTSVRTILCLGVLGAGFIPMAWADVWNKKTTVNFPETVSVPGAVLQPGRYVLQLADSSSNRHIVQVRNEEETHVYATILAIPKYRPQPADKTILTFYEAPVGEPRGLRSWFYPGDTIGQEFPRSKERIQLAALAPTNLQQRGQETAVDDRTVSAPPMTDDQDAAAVAEPTPEPQEPAKQEPAPTQVTPEKPIAEPAEQQAEEQKPAEPAEGGMPETASPLPLMVVLGFSALAAALGLGKRRA